jgi:hypothetical protein
MVKVFILLGLGAVSVELSVLSCQFSSEPV